VIAFHPNTLVTIREWLAEIETVIGQGAYAPEHAARNAQSRVRALGQILSPGFGQAARITPDTPDGSLFVAEYAEANLDDGKAATYVFGCVKHSDGQVGVHS
jgi:hypothetical protein